MPVVLGHHPRVDLGNLGEVPIQDQEVHRHDEGQQCEDIKDSLALLSQGEFNGEGGSDRVHHEVLPQRQDWQGNCILRDQKIS